MERVYSIRHLGLFSKPLLTIKDDGFYYKDRFYTRADVEAVRTTGGFGQPQRLGVRLKGGKLILINAGSLELNGKKAKTVSFQETTKYSRSSRITLWGKVHNNQF